MESPIEIKIQKYLSGNLSEKEHRAFEQEMQEDNALQLRVIRKGFELSQKKEVGSPEAQEMLETIKQDHGPLKTPKLTIWDRIRFWWNKPDGSSKKLFWVLILLTALLGIAQLWESPDQFNITYQEYSIRAHCPGVAGTTIEDKINEIAKCYCTGEAPPLDCLFEKEEKFGDFLLIDYYLAYAHLENGELGKAQNYFDNFLNDPEREKYTNYNNDWVRRYNLLLGKIIDEGPSKELINELEAHIKSGSKEKISPRALDKSEALLNRIK